MCVFNILKMTKAITLVYIVAYFSFVLLCGCSNKQEKELDGLYEGLRNEKLRDESATGFFKNKDNSCRYLLERLEKETDGNMRKITINLIGGLKCQRCEVNLLKYLNDQDWKVRFMTINTFVELNYKDIVPLLYNVIASDNEMRVIGRAIWAMGECGGEKDLAYINQLQNKDKYKSKMMTQYIELANKKYNSRMQVDVQAR